MTTHFLEVRRQLTSAQVKSSVAVRLELSTATKAWVGDLASAVLPPTGFSIVAVGGLGRNELCAGSDIDLLLLHSMNVAPGDVTVAADKLWYPIWDSNLKLDHSVRNFAQARTMAADDFKVLLGLLTAEVIWGDPGEFERLKVSVLTDWRAQAVKRMPELYESVADRKQRSGELAHLLEPDLKEAYGGLRELSVLRAISASWLTDIGHNELTSAFQTLLNVRDGLHRVTGRATDRLSMQEQQLVAELQGFDSDDDLLRAVSMSARKIALASDHAWYRVRRQSSRSRVGKLLRRQEERYPLANGIVTQDGEVLLAESASLTSDPGIVFRAAAAAAQSGLVLSPHTVSRLANEVTHISVPWPDEVRDSLVSFLGAGAAAVPVWEALDQAGLTERLLPFWSDIRSLPQRNALHTYTVDRHSVETAAQAAKFARDVDRPDLLLIAALFHDIGKGQPGHCERGEVLMQTIAPSLGFNTVDSAVLCSLVRNHLLLAETAAARDLDDPATIQNVAERVGSPSVLDLLWSLTIADSKATGSNIWGSWKATLVADLVSRVRALLENSEVPEAASFMQRLKLEIRAGHTDVLIDVLDRGAEIQIATPDRVGLLSAVAAALSVARLEVRSAAVETVDGIALQLWHVHPVFGEFDGTDELRRSLLSAIADESSVVERARLMSPSVRSRGFIPPEARVRHLPRASLRSTVIEVRAHDEPALLHRIASVVAQLQVDISHAKALTLGSEVVDVLYLREKTGEVLSADRCDAVVQGISTALAPNQ